MNRGRLVSAILLPALLLAMLFISRATAREVDTKGMGRLQLPDRLAVSWAGDTLIVNEAAGGHVTLRLYRAPDSSVTHPVAWVRARAVQLGLPWNSRQVSAQQRELANISLGVFALGTLPRPVDSLLSGADSTAGRVGGDATRVLPVDSPNVSADSSNAAQEIQVEKTFIQPEGLPAVERMVVLYVKEKQALVLEMSVWLPEGNSMELTDIQRTWRL